MKYIKDLLKLLSLIISLSLVTTTIIIIVYSIYVKLYIEELYKEEAVRQLMLLAQDPLFKSDFRITFEGFYDTYTRMTASYELTINKQQHVKNYLDNYNWIIEIFKIQSVPEMISEVMENYKKLMLEHQKTYTKTLKENLEYQAYMKAILIDVLRSSVTHFDTLRADYYINLFINRFDLGSYIETSEFIQGDYYTLLYEFDQMITVLIKENVLETFNQAVNTEILKRHANESYIRGIKIVPTFIMQQLQHNINVCQDKVAVFIDLLFCQKITSIIHQVFDLITMDFSPAEQMKYKEYCHGLIRKNFSHEQILVMNVNDIFNHIIADREGPLVMKLTTNLNVLLHESILYLQQK